VTKNGTQAGEKLPHVQFVVVTWPSSHNLLLRFIFYTEDKNLLTH